MEFLTPSKIADYCGVTRRTVSRWILKGELKGYTLTGRGNYRVKISDFVEFLSKQGLPIPEALQNTSILVVDDDHIITDTIVKLLARKNFEVHSANDGFQAAVKLLRHRPRLVILDLEMPGLDGFEVISLIRSSHEFVGTKIAVLSAHAQTHEQRLKQLQLHSVMDKPFDIDQLFEVAESAFSDTP